MDRVIWINKRTVAGTSEPYALLSEGSLESGCARPRQVYSYDPLCAYALMATRLLFGIASNHPFQQGNKRTGFHAMNAFLFKNGFRLDPLDDITWALAITAVIDHQATEDMFEAWIAPKLVPIERVGD